MPNKIVNAQISANANSLGSLTLATQDDNQARTVTGIWANDVTKLVRTQLNMQGKVVVDYDDFLNSLLNQPLPISVTFPAGVQIILQLQNGTGGNITNVNVAIFYSVPN